MGQSDIYEKWKPLRNYLRKFDILSSLEALWWYSWRTVPLRHMVSVAEEPLPGLMKAPFIDRPDEYPLVQWNVTLMAEEVIMNGSLLRSVGLRTFLNGNDFTTAINKMKVVENAASEATLTEAHVLDELFRISHQQFKYQKDFYDYATSYRYYRIWSHGKMDAIVKIKTGLDAKTLFSASLLVSGLYMKNPVLEKIDGLKMLGLVEDDITKLFALVSRPLSEVRAMIEEVHRTDNAYAYQYNPLFKYPIIEIDGGKYLCPTPIDYQLRITHGVYYDLFDAKDFDNSFGESFQQYVGDMLKATFVGSNVAIYEEETEKIGQADWIIDQPDSFVLVECKTKRPISKAVVEIMDLSTLEEQLAKIAEAIRQAYQAYLNFRDHKYKNPIYMFNGRKKASVCVVTLEPWYIFGGIFDRLKQLLLVELAKNNINATIIDEVPYAVISIAEFEELAFAMKANDSHKMLGTWYTKFPTYGMEGCLTQLDPNWKKGYDYIFKNNLLECFTPQMQKIMQEIWKSKQ